MGVNYVLERLGSLIKKSHSKEGLTELEKQHATSVIEDAIEELEKEVVELRRLGLKLLNSVGNRCSHPNKALRVRRDITVCQRVGGPDYIIEGAVIECSNCGVKKLVAIDD